jgi:predicted molibdopterin-dependent oxidoreductase YjgC
LLVVGDALDDVSAADLAGLSSLVYIGTTLPPVAAQSATVVLPITTTIEEEGTFTNLRGRVQRFLQARTAPGVARPTWYVLADLVAAAGGNGQYVLPSEVFSALAASQPAFAGLEYEALGLRGLPVLEQGVEALAGVGA